MVRLLSGSRTNGYDVLPSKRRIGCMKSNKVHTHFFKLKHIADRDAH
jgi:hypothetical protein